MSKENPVAFVFDFGDNGIFFDPRQEDKDLSDIPMKYEFTEEGTISYKEKDGCYKIYSIEMKNPKEKKNE